MSSKTRPFFLYFFALLFLLVWWFTAFAFPQKTACCHAENRTEDLAKPLPPPDYLYCLSSMDREKIRLALSGDIKTMVDLITEWEVDYQILKNQKLSFAGGLTREKYVRAQLIGRYLLHPEKQKKESLASLSTQVVADDAGSLFDPEKNFQKVLPQTYAAASIVLALTAPENIAALPEGFRLNDRFFPRTLLDSIPLDTNRFNGEKIFRERPNVAFVADYSHPSTLQALQNQGIPLFTLKAAATLPEMEQAIVRIGQVIRRPLESELLALFMESAMLAIDNHLFAYCQSAIEKEELPTVLFLHYISAFSHPTEKTITGQLLERLRSRKFRFASFQRREKNCWTTPVDAEQILQLDPDCLIIAASNVNEVKNILKENKAYHMLAANKKEAIYFIENAPQNPTQFIILAYYDIASALSMAASPYLRGHR